MSLYESVFELSDFWLFIVCIAAVWLLTLCAAVTMIALKVAFPHKNGAILTSTVLSGILLPTGLVIAFVASDVWQRNAQGHVAVQDEASAISDSLRVIKHLPAELADPVRSLIDSYIREAAQIEWPLMEQGQSSEKLDEYLEAMMFKAIDLQAQQGSLLPIVGRELDRYITRIEHARDVRLRVSRSHVSQTKWVTVLIMLFACACVLVELHIMSRRSVVISTALFALGFGVTIYLISAYDRPFTGKTIIEPWPLQQALVRVGKERVDNNPR